MLYDWKEEAKLVAEYEVENERIEKVVKNMLNDNITVENISKYTGLSLEEINKIKDIN